MCGHTATIDRVSGGKQVASSQLLLQVRRAEMRGTYPRPDRESERGALKEPNYEPNDEPNDEPEQAFGVEAPCAVEGVLAVAGDLVRIPQERRQDRTVLIELGRHLAPQLRQSQQPTTQRGALPLGPLRRLQRGVDRKHGLLLLLLSLIHI